MASSIGVLKRRKKGSSLRNAGVSGGGGGGRRTEVFECTAPLIMPQHRIILWRDDRAQGRRRTDYR